MANYFLNDDGSTSLKRKNRNNGKNYIQQDDGSTIEEVYEKPKKQQLPKAKKKESNQGSFSNSLNNFSDTLKNSYVKNNGFNVSNAITDLANINDAGKNVLESLPVAGNIFKAKNTLDKTSLNAMTNLGTGALKSLEGTADFLSDLIVNPAEQGLNYAIDYVKSGKKVAKENLEDLKKMQKRDIKRNLTKEFQDKTGYTDIVDDLEDGSLIKRDNLGGQVSQAVGGMVPSLIMGNAFAGAEPVLQSTDGLSKLDKAKVIAGNVGKSFVSQLPSNMMLGTSSYGSGLEEALNSGASIDKARLYGIGNSAKEMATEWITGGIPGLEGKGGLDLPVEKLIDKTTGKIKNEYAKAFAKTILDYGYKFVGEGLEEGLSEIIDPFLKNATYSNNEKVNWEDVFSSFVVGGLTGGFLEAPNTLAEFNNNIAEANNNVQQKKTMLPVASNSNKNITQSQNNIEGNPLIENKNSVSLPLDKNTINKLNSVNQSQERFIYEASDNSKIDNFRKSANQFMNNSNETKSFVQTVEKVINDKNYNVSFDNSLGDNVNGRIGINENGEVDIRINPNSDRAGEFILTHEITHAIDNNEMRNLVIDYASKNSEFNEALESLKHTYNVDDVNDEVLADISGQLFGTEEFINKLSTSKPNLFKRIYDKIISFANKITGNTKESLFIKDLKNKWEKAYREANLDTSKEKLKSSKFSIKENGKGKYVEIDTDQDIFDNIEEKDYNKIAKLYINDYLKGNTQLSNNDVAVIDSTSSKKYTNPGKRQNYFTEKMKLTPELKNVLEIAQKVDSSLPSKENSKYSNWEYYKFDFNLNGENFEGLVNIGIDSNNNKHFYEVNNIKKRTDGISETSLNSPISSISNNISQNEEKVNNFEDNKVEESVNDSFSFDENAKRYDDLLKAKKIEYFKKDNGDVRVYIIDSNNNLINEIDLFSSSFAIKQLGEGLGKTIFENANEDNKTIDIGNDINNSGSDTDYFMNHRPTETGAFASDITDNGNLMPSDVYDHPEYYFTMDKSHKESIDVLRKVRNNPNAEITIYRATPGDKINYGDWITLSKDYAQIHNESQFEGKANILELKVKASDIQYAGDDICEFGYYPGEPKYSKNSKLWQNYLEKNYNSKGTKTNFNDTRLDKNNTEENILNREKEKISKKYEREKNTTKKTISKEVAKILEFDDYQQKKKFTELVSEYYENPDLNKIRQDIKDNFSEKRVEYVNDYVKDIKNIIRGTDLQITDYVRRNFTDFGNFRKENFNRLKLKNQGQSIDSFYSELSDDYPSIFSKNITNEVDQLARLSEFMSEDDKFYEKYNLDDGVINKAAQYVYDSIKNKDNIDDLINSISISPKQIRKEKTAEYREYAEVLVSNSDNWVDKKLGLSYKTNTMKRNFYDVMGKKDGGILYRNYIEPIFDHNAQMQKDISSYNEKISKLNLSEKESTAVQMFGEYKYNPETLVTGPEVDDFISNNKLDHKKIENAVEVFRTTYDELIERVNETLKSQGYKEIDYRKGYFPHFVDDGAKSKFGKVLEKMGWKFKDDSIPTDIAGITDIFKPGKVWNRNAQQRNGRYTDFNALKGFDNYIRGAMETIYFTEDIQKLRALENEIRYQHSEKGIQTKIDEILSDTSIDFEDRQEKIDKIFATYRTPLNNLVSEIRDYTNGIANKKSILDRTMEQATNRKVYSVMQNISNRLSANMVGLNLSSAITNFIPITQAASQVKSKYLLKGLQESIKNQSVADNFESKSVFLTSRLNEADKLFKTRLEKISDKANFMFDGIDSITSNTIVRGKYYENIANGMSEYNAMRNADEFARDLMAGRTKGEMPTIFNSKNPIIKLFTSFQLEVNNQYEYMFKDIPRDLKDDGLKKILSAYVKMFFGAWIYNQITEKLVGRKSAFSPVDTLKEVFDTSTNKNLKITDKSAKILKNLTQDVPFVGGLIGGGRLPISSVANPLNVIKGESSVSDEAKKLLYYTVLPFGGGQLKKTVEGSSMYINNKEIKGSYTNKGKLRFEAKKDVGSIAQNVLFGQYSSKEAREYFDKGYLPIDSKTVEKLKKQGISISDYRKYTSDKNELGLNNIKSDKDDDGKTIKGTASAKKALAIMNSNYSKNEKEYLISNLSNSNNSIIYSDLKNLKMDEKTYKFYFGLSDENRKKFKKEINELGMSSNELIKYYDFRKKYKETYTSNYYKNNLMNYINNLNVNNDTKWYLYNKDYGSDNLSNVVEKFNLKYEDYYNVKKYSDDISSKYSGSKNSKIRKEMVFKYINGLKLNKVQKSILFKEAGYSDSISKQIVFNYINTMDISKSEKQKLYDSIF